MSGKLKKRKMAMAGSLHIIYLFYSRGERMYNVLSHEIV